MKLRTFFSLALIGSMMMSAPTLASAKTSAHVGKTYTGGATYYGGKGWHGRKTASGERLDDNKYTAAHLTLPFGTYVKVTDLNTQRSVVVKINDRGPYGKRFIIDLSVAAARELNLLRRGVTQVRLEVLGKNPHGTAEKKSLKKQAKAKKA